jgi:hypothetical protein
MKRKFRFLLVVMPLFFAMTVNAQFASSITSGSATVNGTPYLDDVYANGVICLTRQNFSVPIRYNVFRDVIEYQQNGSPLVLSPGTTIKRVTVGNFTFVPLPYESNGKSKYGFFVLLDSGKVTLLAKKKIIFLEAKKGGALDGTDQPAEYRKTFDTFYFKTGNGQLQEIRSIKSMIASLPDKQEELTQFAKKEKISPRKENELIQFVQYYNSL